MDYNIITMAIQTENINGEIIRKATSSIKRYVFWYNEDKSIYDFSYTKGEVQTKHTIEEYTTLQEVRNRYDVLGLFFTL